MTKSKDRPTGAGKSSFRLIDSDLLFAKLRLRNGQFFLDLACGLGEYSLGAVKYLGKSGKVYAFDLWEEGIEHLSEKAKRKGYKNIYPLVVDLSQEIPLPDTTVDTALIATAFHDLIQDGSAVKTVEEAYRVLKDKGKLAIVEFKKIEHLPLRQKVFVCRLKN